jgi:hypothetical protein
MTYFWIGFGFMAGAITALCVGHLLVWLIEEIKHKVRVWLWLG